VSHVHELFSSILSVEEERLSKEMSVTETLELISAVNSILQVALLFHFFVSVTTNYLLVVPVFVLMVEMKSVNLWRYLCASLLYFVVRVRYHH